MRIATLTISCIIFIFFVVIAGIFVIFFSYLWITMLPKLRINRVVFFLLLAITKLAQA